MIVWICQTHLIILDYCSIISVLQPFVTGSRWGEKRILVVNPLAFILKCVLVHISNASS